MNLVIIQKTQKSLIFMKIQRKFKNINRFHGNSCKMGPQGPRRPRGLLLLQQPLLLLAEADVEGGREHLAGGAGEGGGVADPDEEEGGGEHLRKAKLLCFI